MPQIVMRILRDRQEQARRGIDEFQMIEADARKFGKSNRQDRKIDAGDAETKRETANHRAAGRCCRYGGEEAKPRGDAETSKQYRGNVAAETGIDRMTERKLPGKSHHDVPGLTGKGEIENDDQNRQQVVVDEPWRDQKQRQQRAE